MFCFASKSSFYSKSVCAFFCFFFFFFFFLYTTETLNKAHREKRSVKRRVGSLKSRTQTRAHKTPSLSLSLSLSYSLTLIKVHDRLKSSRPWYDFATATTTVYPSCGRLFSFERCDWITPSSSLLCRRFRPLIVPLDLSSSFKSVSPVSLSLSLSLPNDDDDANDDAKTKTKTGQASERGDAPTHRRLPRRRGIREHF